MTKQKEKKEVPQLSKVNCPRCNHPMVPKSNPGFGNSDKLVCTNLSCPTHQPARGWG